MRVTPHAQMRMQQRGLNGGLDVQLFEKYASEFTDGLIMRRKDVVQAIGEIQAEMDSLKAEKKRLEKIRNKSLITDGDNIVTAYKPSRRRAKRFLRTMR